MCWIWLQTKAHNDCPPTAITYLGELAIVSTSRKLPLRSGKLWDIGSRFPSHPQSLTTLIVFPKEASASHVTVLLSSFWIVVHVSAAEVGASNRPDEPIEEPTAYSIVDTTWAKRNVEFVVLGCNFDEVESCSEYCE